MYTLISSKINVIHIHKSWYNFDTDDIDDTDDTDEYYPDECPSGWA